MALVHDLHPLDRRLALGSPSRGCVSPTSKQPQPLDSFHNRDLRLHRRTEQASESACCDEEVVPAAVAFLQGGFGTE